MTWSFSRINKEYLVNQAFPQVDHDIVEAFNLCENYLGTDWIESCFCPTFGALPTLRVFKTGQYLKSLSHLKNPEVLISKLRAEDRSAFVELEALTLLIRAGVEEAEAEPQQTVAGSNRAPDFRVRRNGESLWTAAEVTQPDDSELSQKLFESMAKVTELVQNYDHSFELDIYLLKEPSERELHLLLEHTKNVIVENKNKKAIELGKTALITYSQDPTDASFSLNDYGLPDDFARLGRATAFHDRGKLKKISIRIPVTDERAELILKRKSKQLPLDGPGLIMINLLNVTGGSKRWMPLISRRLQPGLNTRVSAVCLIGGGIFTDEDGPKSLIETKLIANSFATHKIPEWLGSSLKEQGLEYEKRLSSVT